MGGGGKGGGGGTQTQTQQNQNVSYNPYAQQNIADVANRAAVTANTPYQQYPGNLVAPLEPSQQAGLFGANYYANYAQPWMNAGTVALTQGALDAQSGTGLINQGGNLAQQGANPVAPNQIANYSAPMYLGASTLAGQLNPMLSNQTADGSSQLNPMLAGQMAGASNQFSPMLNNQTANASGQFNPMLANQMAGASSQFSPMLNQQTAYGAGGLNPMLGEQIGGASGQYSPMLTNQLWNSASQITPMLNDQTTGAVNQFMNPYTQNVIGTTLGNINQQNQLQQQQLMGNATAQGALGGDRSAVMQAELARNQDLAKNQTIGQLEQQGYGQALQTSQQNAFQGLGAAQNAVGQGFAGAQSQAQQALMAALQNTGQGFGGAQSAAQQAFMGALQNAGQGFAGGQTAAQQALMAALQNSGQSFAGGQSMMQQGLTAAQQDQARLLQAAGQMGGLAAQGNIQGAVLGGLGQGFGGLGTQAQMTGLQGANAQLAAGQVAQQTGQAMDTAAYQQYLQALAYPYQQSQFLANIGLPASGAMGGLQTQIGQSNSVVTPPGMSWQQGLLGGGLLASGLFGGSGTGGQNRGGRIPNYDMGGAVPHYDSGGSSPGSGPGSTAKQQDPPQLNPYAPYQAAAPFIGMGGASGKGAGPSMGGMGMSPNTAQALMAPPLPAALNQPNNLYNPPNLFGGSQVSNGAQVGTGPQGGGSNLYNPPNLLGPSASGLGGLSVNPYVIANQTASAPQSNPYIVAPPPAPAPPPPVQQPPPPPAAPAAPAAPPQSGIWLYGGDPTSGVGGTPAGVQMYKGIQAPENSYVVNGTAYDASGASLGTAFQGNPQNGMLPGPGAGWTPTGWSTDSASYGGPGPGSPSVHGWTWTPPPQDFGSMTTGNAAGGRIPHFASGGGEKSSPPPSDHGGSHDTPPLPSANPLMQAMASFRPSYLPGQAGWGNMGKGGGGSMGAPPVGYSGYSPQPSPNPFATYMQQIKDSGTDLGQAWTGKMQEFLPAIMPQYISNPMIGTHFVNPSGNPNGPWSSDSLNGGSPFLIGPATSASGAGGVYTGGRIPSKAGGGPLDNGPMNLMPWDIGPLNISGGSGIPGMPSGGAAGQMGGIQIPGNQIKPMAPMTTTTKSGGSGGNPLGSAQQLMQMAQKMGGLFKGSGSGTTPGTDPSSGGANALGPTNTQVPSVQSGQIGLSPGSPNFGAGSVSGASADPLGGMSGIGGTGGGPAGGATQGITGAAQQAGSEIGIGSSGAPAGVGADAATAAGDIGMNEAAAAALTESTAGAGAESLGMLGADALAAGIGDAAALGAADVGGGLGKGAGLLLLANRGGRIYPHHLRHLATGGSGGSLPPSMASAPIDAPMLQEAFNLEQRQQLQKALQSAQEQKQAKRGGRIYPRHFDDGGDVPFPSDDTFDTPDPPPSFNDRFSAADDQPNVSVSSRGLGSDNGDNGDVPLPRPDPRDVPTSRPIDRTQFLDQIDQNPGLVNRMANMTHGEVGLGNNINQQRTQLESMFNRAQSRGIPLEQALRSISQPGGYYARQTYQHDPITGQRLEDFRNNVLQPVLKGSDVGYDKLGFVPTGNASGNFAANRAANGVYGPHEWWPNTGEPGVNEMFVTEKYPKDMQFAQGIARQEGVDVPPTAVAQQSQPGLISRLANQFNPVGSAEAAETNMKDNAALPVAASVGMASGDIQMPFPRPARAGQSGFDLPLTSASGKDIYLKDNPTPDRMPSEPVPNMPNIPSSAYGRNNPSTAAQDEFQPTPSPEIARLRQQIEGLKYQSPNLRNILTDPAMRMQLGASILAANPAGGWGRAVGEGVGSGVQNINKQSLESFNTHEKALELSSKLEEFNQRDLERQTAQQIQRQNAQRLAVMPHKVGTNPDGSDDMRIFNPTSKQWEPVPIQLPPAPLPEGQPGASGGDQRYAKATTSDADEIEQKGTVGVNREQAKKPYDYSHGSPVIERGMDVPAPQDIGGRSASALQRDAEYYLQTGKLPSTARGTRGPIAMANQNYRTAVQNYGSALAESRGMTPEEMADGWRTAPGMLRFVMGPDGRSTVALGTAVRHLDTLQQLSNAWAANPNSQTVNRLKAIISREFGSEAATNLTSANRIVGAEIIKAIGVAGAGTEDERRAAAQAFSTADSPQQFSGAIRTVQELLGGQLEGRRRQAAASGVSEQKFKQLIGDRPYDILTHQAKPDTPTPRARPETSTTPQPTESDLAYLKAHPELRDKFIKRFPGAALP